MIKTGLPTAMIFGFDLEESGTFPMKTSVYSAENLQEDVTVHVYNDDSNFYKDFSAIRPDIILTIGGNREDFKNIYKYADHSYIASKWCHHSIKYDADTTANDIVKAATNWACSSQELVYNSKENPFFTVFTPTYKTEDKIFRAYESLKNQTYNNWEWVIVDDSPQTHLTTWGILQGIAANDYRVRIVRIFPTSGGNIGEVKNRATSMANGQYLLELDHDDALISTCLEEVVGAIKQYPDAGFFYTNVAEPFEDGTMRFYTKTVGTREEWYANPNNTFVWAYGGHEWVEADGIQYLSHIYPNINPKTIRFNIGMPNHARIWKKDVYDKIGKHNRSISVADDYELIVRTFLNTRMVHIDKMLYLQYNNRNSTVDNNSTDINRKARLIRDYYDKAIHNRIIELGKEDWDWIESGQHSHPFQNDMDYLKYYEDESVLNYIYK
jgi:glycosyltransferase involved in cell wall biosynthesis